MPRATLKTTFCLLAGLSLGGCVTAKAPPRGAEPAQPAVSEVPSRAVRDAEWLRFSVMAELPADSLPDGLEVPPPAAAPGDLLERVRAGYALPDVAHAAIDRELAWYSRHQAYLDRVFGRAALYLPHIVDEIERRQMPLELALLPVVESAFDPFAYSHGRASGLWQFIPGTGRRYGLKRVAYIDIDAHHGDGVFYGFEDDPDVLFADLHEDGRFLYPGTGAAEETGKGAAEGTKLNIPMLPGAGDEEFDEAWQLVEAYLDGAAPEFIIMQCGADSLEGDPITHLRYSEEAHAHAAKRLCKLADRHCGGRIVGTGGGGYNRKNLARAWTRVVQSFANAA